MTHRSWSKTTSGFALLASAIASSFWGCSSGGPRATGTKTDWFRSCEKIEDCGSSWPGSCLCGICTVTCGSDTDCEQGSCGSMIDVAAACGNEDDLTTSGQRICVPGAADACREAPLSSDAPLGEAVAPNCGHPGALICEGFDAPLPGQYSTWGSGASSAGLQECQMKTGAGALRIEAVDDAYVQTRMRLPSDVSSGSIYVRFFLKIEEGGSFPEQLILFELWDQEEGDVVDRTTIYLNDEQQLEVYAGPAPATFEAATMPPLARDTWHCIELGLELSDDAGSVFVGLDETAVIEAAGVDTKPSDPLNVAVIESLPSVGSVGTNVTFYIDDLVVATERVFCD